MAKRYLILNVDNTLAVGQIIGSDADGAKVTKLLFELSITTDTTTHFDPAVHTREAIAAGLEGHRPLALLVEIEDTDVPTDFTFRSAWEWED